MFETFTNNTKTTFKKLIEEESSQVIVCDGPPHHLHEFVISIHRLTLSRFEVFLSHVCDLSDLSLVYISLMIFLFLS